ncbi:hydantoinase/oxoprolinase family protein [Cryobacterium levicorallinum]|uniref:Hydantoinase/oxoprolinase family protein n=1 Tax=Cryobacterium levicorallinum TaxID=995038 RepID=A0A1I3BIB3_9MICO|nr:hydantoinase/oxoprolinase family protein [Cryobacterium levicorallinum]TFB82060.1 hydantoinase/oxoprolinase family protein [Cryobacterium levicorallinum]GEP27993.1 5-oxoprolinase [Cryobacterium levicorallinum]SFH61481.1 N-methylhydantoinase A/oxoprolinase/acetone carboxylase, beta subunit [Cryobacterium levicorallinum]
MERLINIDNGGTLTDIVVASGTDFTFTKTLTTPVDLSQCLFDAMTKASALLFGEANLADLLHSTQHIRYSSTQGTNALVQRKGPKIGLITDDPTLPDSLGHSDDTAALFTDLIGARIGIITADGSPEELSRQLVAEINRLTTAGAERLVVAGLSAEREHLFKRTMLKNFPRHLLGSVPILFSREFASDTSRQRQVWSGILNSFLHPTVERFLYSAEHRLRAYKVKNPLLIYRNDGASSRVAKSVALKTYSSGPRGGLEGTRALAEAYGLDNVLMIDVGGTTTDVGAVANSTIAVDRRGSIQGVDISYEMSDVRSTGVGGSSIIAVHDGEITVGPESVGAAPGPACFGFGGTQATITDVNLLLGVLDPATYLNGEMALDAERSRAVITKTVADPLGISLDEALIRMEASYSSHLARAFADLVSATGDTTVAAFGGGGPMNACAAARIAGVHNVLVPRLAAVFSAYGISFSDIAQSYETSVTGFSEAEITAVRTSMQADAGKDMFQEGHDLSECELDWSTIVEDGEEILSLKATFRLPHPTIASGVPAAASAAVAAGTRQVRSTPTQIDSVSVYQLDDQKPGAAAAGPAIVEGPFFTARVPLGWTLTVSTAGDLQLADTL